MNTTEIPCLGSVARFAPSVEAGAMVNTVIECFGQDQELLALPVMSNGVAVGIISRRELFYRHLAKPFARELYGKKPVMELMSEESLILPAKLDIHSGLQALLQRDPGLANDCFGVEDQGCCTGVVSVADLMISISNSQSMLLNRLEQLNRRIFDEVEMARCVQAILLPETPLRHGALTVAGGLVNSTEISGDFYDVFPLDDQRIGVIVADVTGHGVQAGLVTTAAKAGLQILLDADVRTPAQILVGINRAICATARGKLLMTAVAVIIDQATGTAELSSAGHPFPYHSGAGCEEWMQIELEPGFPLGFDECASYAETQIAFQAGDRLLLFSDGIQEAENDSGEPFGENRLLEVLCNEHKAGPAALRDELLKAARSFVGRDSFDDDVTLVVAMLEGRGNDTV